MALFKPMYGSNKTALNAKNLVEGYCWFTTDDGKFYVDTKNSSGVLSRILLNAGKADQLATARTFQIADNDATNKGPTVSFNGSANVIINLPSTIKASLSGNASSASSLQSLQTLTTDELIDNFVAANTLQVALWNHTSSPGTTNGTIISGGWNNTTYGWQLAIDDDPTYYMALRQKSTTWGAWKRIPMGDGTGASGTWGISISGNAATATQATSIKDSGDGRTLYVNYSTAGMSSTSWLASWNGNTLQSIAPSVLKVGQASQLASYSTAGEYTKNSLAYFNEAVKHSGTAQKGVNDGPTTTNTWWHFLRFTHSNSAGYYTDLAVPFTENSLYYKRIADGSVQNASTNAGWVQVLDVLNYTSYCAKASHSHSYLPLSGGAMTGRITQIYGTAASTIGNMYTTAAIQIRENDVVGTTQSDIKYAPTLGFHWSGRVAGNLSLHSDGILYWYNNAGNLGNFKAGSVYGAVWNDYAEYRQGQKEYRPGTCVIEVGDDTLVASTERLQSGALIVSDTFGFAIGETDEAKTPVATSGRVLAYTFEPRESYSAGDPVCSGPNGTVSKMTEQEVMMYPHKMIGTVSAIPDYEEWGTGKVKVDGRIWIQVR